MLRWHKPKKGYDFKEYRGLLFAMAILHAKLLAWIVHENATIYKLSRLVSKYRPKANNSKNIN